MIRTIKVLSFLLLGLTAVASAQTQSGSGADASMMAMKAGPNFENNPVAEVRQEKSWHYGPFLNGGTGLGDRDNFQFFSVGFELGKPISRVLRAGIFSGQFEFAGNIMPFWQAYTPAPHDQEFIFNNGVYDQPIGGGTFTGASITPVIFRWNFATHARRIQPWFQAAGGLVYTTHKFPPDVLVPHGTPGATSVFNFSPQGGGGVHYFVSRKRSIDLGINGVHISSASLGDHNPGVNSSVQVQLGYTWWK